MNLFWKKLLAAFDRFRDGLTEAQYDTVRAIAILALLGVAGTGIYFVGRPLWTRWQNHEALVQADSFAREKDYSSMLLALRRATESAPADPSTWRQVVDHLAAIASPEATLQAREQLVRLAPQDVAARTALVEVALKSGRYDIANAAMAGFPGTGRSDAAYDRLAVAVAMAEGRSNELPGLLDRVIAADPADLNARFTYASLQLWGQDPLARDAAQAELENLVPNRSFRIRASIELLSEAGMRNDPVRIHLLLTWLLSYFAPNARPDFRAPTVPGWNSLVGGIKSAAAAGPASDAALVARWLADMGRRRDALAWLLRLPAAIQSDPVALDMETELTAEEQDLTRLDRLLQDGAWGPLPDEARLLALSSRLAALKSDGSRGRKLWSDAVMACGDSLGALRALARLADAWHDTDGAETALRKILDHSPRNLWVYDVLRTSYSAHGDLRDLWGLYSQWILQAPEDREIAAQWILAGCILDKATPDAYARAATLGTEPESCALARAAALWRQGKPEDAWSLLAGLPDARRRDSATAFWIALVAADTGRHSEALQAIAAARSAPLPAEETALLQDAANKAGVPADP